MAIAFDTTIQNQDFFARIPNGLTKWQPFVRISHDWASRFQIPFKIRTICSPTAFRLFEIQTVPISDPQVSGQHEQILIFIKYSS